jgi:methyl-accepting chemotaxis protein
MSKTGISRKGVSEMFYIRVFLITVTAFFMSFHVQIFIYRIEPNLLFSWTAAFLIEGFLISLAMSKTIASRILLIPLFLISVIAASASFIVQNEQLLDELFTQKRVIEQLEKDLKATQKAYQFGERYVTRTLQRERQLRDELRAIMREKEGDVTLINSLIFFLIILVIQSANVYTAMTLKNGKFQKQATEISETKDAVSDVSGSETKLETLKQVSETAETRYETIAETAEKKTEDFAEVRANVPSVPNSVPSVPNSVPSVPNSVPSVPESDKDIVIAGLKKLRGTMSLREIAQKFGIPKTTLSRIISTQGQGISDEIFRKISEKL